MATFKNIWQSMKAAEKKALADEMDTSVAYLSQVAHGHANASPRFLRLLSMTLDRDLAA